VRILVVDDQRDMLLLLQQMLAKTSHEVTLAQDPRNALTMIQHLDFDVFLFDLKMPNFSGEELIRKARQIRLNTRIIAMTGADGSSPDIVGPDGADRIMYKPFNRTALFTSLEI
jgi:DNA-binding response OmpR family regulator